MRLELFTMDLRDFRFEISAVQLPCKVTSLMLQININRFIPGSSEPVIFIYIYFAAFYSFQVTAPFVVQSTHEGTLNISAVTHTHEHMCLCAYRSGGCSVHSVDFSLFGLIFSDFLRLFGAQMQIFKLRYEFMRPGGKSSN